MSTENCPGCDRPDPQDWCWIGRDIDCPLGRPPRWAMEGDPGVYSLWQLLRDHLGPRVPSPVRVIDLRDSDGAMSWGVADKHGVIIAQFDRQNHAEQFAEFFAGMP